MLNKAFLCHSSKDQLFVLQVAAQLRRQFDDVFTYETKQPSDQAWMSRMLSELRESHFFVVFLGSEFSLGQENEKAHLLTLEHQEHAKRCCVVVAIAGQKQIEDVPAAWLDGIRDRPFLPDNYTRPEVPRVVDCARDIVVAMNYPGFTWKALDRLPINPHLFDYEKRITDFFVTKANVDLDASNPDEKTEKKIRHVRELLKGGCPGAWPQAQRLPDYNPDDLDDNRLPQRGEDRADSSTVVAAALSPLGAAEHGLVFREAGPRAGLFFPRRRNRALCVGIIVLGGIAPGINTVIDAIVHRHSEYEKSQRHNLRIYGFLNGFWAFEDIDERTRLLRPHGAQGGVGGLNVLETSKRATEGGSMLGTWREPAVTDVNEREGRLMEIANSLYGYNIDILYVIGGDGSMKAAHALYYVAQEYARIHQRPPLSIVGVPKTMDNDILWMWQSFGFASAVQKAREIVAELHTEVESNPRLCVLQLYGSDSGFVVSHTVLASATGHCDLALIPEQPFNLIQVAEHLKQKIHKDGRPIPYGLVVMAETTVPEDALACIGIDTPSTHHEAYKRLNDPVDGLRLIAEEKRAINDYYNRRKAGQRIQGQTDDTLRQASLHLVSRGLEILLKLPDISPEVHDDTTDWRRLRLVTNEPRHLLRATPPSTSDITMAQRLGILAVDNALAGYTDFMISQWLTEYVLIPLELVVLGRKRIPRDGIFWKSVMAKTGQPSLQ